jgi:hypothetical protein
MSTQLLRRLGTVSIALVSFGAAPALAVTLDDLIDRLDADDFATRETAADELHRKLMDDVDERSIEAARALEMDAAEALRTRDLSLEQRLRLIDALRERFVRSPRGAMGVSFGQQNRLLGVELQLVMPNFPAAESGALKKGDVITSVCGMSLLGPEFANVRADGFTGASQRLRHIVISHDPGQTVEMTLVRPLAPAGVPEQVGPNVVRVPGGGDLITEGPGKNAEVLTVQVPLAPFDQLGQGGRLDADTLEGAWRQRAERLGIPAVASRPLGTPLTHADWIKHRRAPNREGAPALLAFAGQAGADEFANHDFAGATFPAGEVQIQQVPPPIGARIVRGVKPNPARVHDIGQIKPAWREPQAPAVAAQGPGFEDIMMLLQNIGSLTSQKVRLLQRAADPTMGDKQRRLAAEEAARIQGIIKEQETALKRKIEENVKAQEAKEEK